MTPEEIKQVEACAHAIADETGRKKTTVDERSYVWFLQTQDDAELTDVGRMRLNRIAMKLGV